ncbi:MAG: hypothetical protein IPK83_21085 [Planctomycetes bacterium]|nr:hypothetical protein [Planctomycetota bacterium]
MRTIVAVTLVMVLALAIATSGEPPQVKSEKPTPIVVASDAIGKRVIIHGKLNRPLGSLLKAVGICAEESEPKSMRYADSLFLVVESVDGVKLDEAVKLEVREFGPGQHLEMKVGKRYEIRGYEHGFFFSLPQPALDLYNKTHKGRNFATDSGYIFVTSLVVVTAKEL